MLHVFRLLKIFAVALVLLGTPTAAFAQLFVGISVDLGPPALPVYEQPVVPAPNYVWTPGYWAWGPGGYFWVPGTWVLAPDPGLLWTPGYWGWSNGYYQWNPGYWANTVGFYGGINYGYGYFGNGYVGGGWQGNQFRYNTAVTNVNTGFVHNVYSNSFQRANNFGNRVAFNGGPNGIQAQPSAGQLAVMHGHHVALTAVQRSHITTAAANRNFLATVNHGRPTVAAVARPLSTANRPAGFAPLAASERRSVQSHVVSNAQTPHTVGTQTHVQNAAITHAAVVHHAAVMHATTVQHAAVMHTAPVQHAAVMHTAPVQHAAVMHTAPVQHAAVMHTAPVQHAAMMRTAPVQHAAVMHAPPVQHAAAAHAPAKGPADTSHDKDNK